MESQDHNLQGTSQPNEMAGREDGAAQMPSYDASCQCTTTSECLWCNSKTNNAVSASNAVEESTFITPTETSDAADEFSRIREHPCLGRYQLQPTSAWYNLCGMFALWVSTDLQLEFELLPDEFNFFYFSQEMQVLNEQNGVTNVDNFHDYQLAKVLHLWSRFHYFLGDVQLGIIVEGAVMALIMGEDKFVLVSSAADMERERDFKTVWIHNDNAVALFGAGMNHYSGIRLLGPIEEPSHSSEDGSGAKMEDDADMRRETKQEDSAENSSGPLGKESGTVAGSGTETEDHGEAWQF